MYPLGETRAKIQLGHTLRPNFFFSVQRLHGFRQVVQHVLLHVANWD